MKASICTLLARKWDISDIANRISKQTYSDIEWVIVDFFYEQNKVLFKHIADQYNVNLHHVPNVSKGFPYMRDIARNRNFAISESVGDAIVFLDDYTVIDSDFIEQHMKVVLKGNISCGRMYYYKDSGTMPELLGTVENIIKANPDFVNDSRHDLLVPYAMQDKITDVLGPEWTYTGNLAFNREVALRINGFDPKLSSRGEDGDFGLRAHGVGYKSMYNPFAHSINLPTGQFLCKNLFNHQHDINFLMEKDKDIVSHPDILEDTIYKHSLRDGVHYAICKVCSAEFMLNVPDYIYDKVKKKEYLTTNTFNLEKRRTV